MGQARERGRLGRLILLAALLGCQPAPDERPAGDACVTSPPPPGEVIVSSPRCTAMRLPGGEGRPSDVWLANHWFRAVIRHPESALGVTGVGGGTLIDAAPWGYADRLHEAVPVVDGGWLVVDAFEVRPDRVIVAGTLAPLPFGPEVDRTARRAVAWVVEPDGPWLRLDGTDSLWIRPAGGLERLDDMLVGDLTYGHDGMLAEDLGGAVRIDGLGGLLVAPSDEAPGWWAEPTRRIEGAADDADHIVLARDGVVVGRLPVDGAFDLRIQDDVDAIRAEAAGRAPGPWVAPGTGLALSPGETGLVRISTEGPPTARVAWTDAAGRVGVEVVRPRGAPVALGEGRFRFEITAGPAWVPRSTWAVVRPGVAMDAHWPLTPRFDPGPRVLADLGGVGSRSWTWRGTDDRALDEAASDGVGFVVVAPEGDVADALADADTAGRVRWRDGVRLTSRRGFSIVAWPWGATPNGGGHGAVDLADLDAEDALAAAWGGPGTSRFTVVDEAWLAQAGSPWAASPRPDFVRLDAPGPDGPSGGAWDVWAAWLDAGVALVPTGPLTWVEVDDPDAFAGVDVEQGLVRGRVVATTGGLVTLAVDGTGPGGVVARPRPEGHDEPRHEVVVGVASADRRLTRAALVRDGREIASWDPREEPKVRLVVPPGRGWIVAAAWSDDGTDWAVTGPVWLDPP